LLARRRVDVPQFAVLACVVALDEGKLLAVGTPLHGFRSAAGDATVGEDGLDGQRLLGLVGVRSLRIRERSKASPDQKCIKAMQGVSPEITNSAAKSGAGKFTPCARLQAVRVVRRATQDLLASAPRFPQNH